MKCPNDQHRGIALPEYVTSFSLIREPVIFPPSLEKKQLLIIKNFL